MGLFSRGHASSPGAQHDAFWQWWDESGQRLTTGALARNDPMSVSDAISAAVETIHPELAWELAAGEVSEHVLVVTAGGNPDLRAAARRWLLAAPPADEVWSYADFRPPATDPESIRLSSGQAPDIDFGRVCVSARLSGSRFDTVVFHPAFADLDPHSRSQVAFLALDATLGEHDVELWIGEVTASEISPVDGFGLRALRAVVRDHSHAKVDEDGRPSWILMQGETPQGPLLAAAQVPLHPATAPHLGTHVAVLLPYRHRTAEGLPADASLSALRQFEDGLAQAMGTDGQVVAHQSSNGTRVLHLYVDDTSGATHRAKAAARRWPEGKAHVQAMADPGWQSVSHLRA